jgi:hypothetical protein
VRDESSSVFAWAFEIIGHSKMALLLGYVISLVSTFILAVAFLCAMANLGVITHESHKYVVAQHKGPKKESLSKRASNGAAARRQRFGAMTTDDGD